MVKPIFEPSSLNVSVDADKIAFASVQDVSIPATTEVTASVQGGDGLITMHSLQHVKRVHKFFTPEEIAEMPRHMREKAKKNGYFDTEEIAQTDGATPLHVARGNLVFATVRFLASTQQLQNVTTGTLIINSPSWDPVAIPLTFGTGSIHAVITPDHVAIRENESVNVKAQITSTIGPDTDVHFRFARQDVPNAFVLHAPSVRVRRGGSIDATWSVFVDDRARLGTFDVDVVVTAFDGRFVKHERFKITVLPNVEIEIMEASREIERFHRDSKAVLRVGRLTGHPVRSADGTVTRSCSVGSISKPLNEPPRENSRFKTSVKIAAVRCFGTEDPSGEDEPYLVISIWGFDNVAADTLLQTVTVERDNTEESVKAGQVFLHGKAVGREIFFPGEGGLRITVNLHEEEQGNKNEMREKQHQLIQTAIGFGLGKINEAVAVAAELTGILEAATKTVTAGIAEIFGDDLVASRTFLLDNETAVQIAQDPKPRRTSGSIPGVKYNFPTFVEDDSAEGKGWLFEGGGGSYRVFFTLHLERFGPQP